MNKKLLQLAPAAILALAGVAYGAIALSNAAAPGISNEAAAIEVQLTANDELNPSVTARDWTEVNGTRTASKPRFR